MSPAGGRVRPARGLRRPMLPQREEIASVVVCEDDAITLDLLCDHLAADRFGVMPAPSASDALRLCRYNHPDLLLLDLVAARRLRPRRPARDPRGRRGRLPLRPPPAGDRPHRSRRRDRPRPRARLGSRRLPGEAVPLPRAASPHRRRPAPPQQPQDGPRPGRRARHRPDPPPGHGRRARGRPGEEGVRRCSRPRLATRPASSPRKSCSTPSGATAAPPKTRTLDSHASRLRRKLDPEHGRFVVNCWGWGYRLVAA